MSDQTNGCDCRTCKRWRGANLNRKPPTKFPQWDWVESAYDLWFFKGDGFSVYVKPGGNEGWRYYLRCGEVQWGHSANNARSAMRLAERHWAIASARGTIKDPFPALDSFYDMFAEPEWRAA